jgi:hypothetical protein
MERVKVPGAAGVRVRPEITGGASVTVIEYPRAPKQPRASVAVTVKEKTPLCVGVPESAPVAEESVNPGGSAPPVTVKAEGPTPPLDENVALYAVPTDPAGRVAGESARAEQTRSV